MVFFAVVGGVVGVVVIAAADSDDCGSSSSSNEYEARKRAERQARREHKKSEMESYRNTARGIVGGQMQDFLKGTRYAGNSYDQLENTDPSQINDIVKKSIASLGQQKANGVAMPIKKEIADITQAITDLENAHNRLSSEVKQ